MRESSSGRRRDQRSAGLVACTALFLTACVSPTPGAESRDSGRRADRPPLESREVHASSNPILGDGNDYTSDPAPLVVDGTLYLLTGRDMARPDVNDFVMPEWQMLVTRGDPRAGTWRHYPHLLKPEEIFAWATPGRAYAAQIVRGVDGRFYLYAPVVQAASTNRDRFAIGVAVADSPLGPWLDAHPEGPVVSQSHPIANDIQNIDPSVLVDRGRVFLYWGTFGRLKGVELERDMVTFKGTPIDVRSLTGFFEAPWLFTRNGTYYMAYAANSAGPESECTEAVYYACIAYASASSPLGPWTYRGVMLDPVSSTTSHPGIVERDGTWFLAYHTADAVGGGHFRRSVAIDTLAWDDAVSPPRIRKVVPSGGAPFNSAATANIASHARVTVSNTPVPVQYWMRALNDGKVRANPLPPDMWATWSRNNPPQQWSVYQWDAPETLQAASLHFWSDHAAGSGVGVAPPREWYLEYWNGTQWQSVHASTPYTSTVGAFNRVDFAPVTTRCLRAVFNASTDGSTFAAVAVQEWQVFSVRARAPLRNTSRQPASPTCAERG